MGNCCSTDRKGRQQDLRNRNREASLADGRHPPGTPVLAEWEKDIFPAFLCSDRGDCVDLIWADGSYSDDRPRQTVRKVLRRWRVGDPVLAKFDRTWFPGEIDQVQAGGLTYVIKWHDGTYTDSVSIIDVKEDPDRPPVSSRRMGSMRLHGMYEMAIVKARKLPKTDTTVAGKAVEGDPFCEVFDSHGRKVVSTPVVRKTTSPEWNFRVQGGVCLADTDILHFVLKDQDLSGNEKFADCVLDIDNGLGMVMEGFTFAGWLPLTSTSKSAKPSGELYIWIKPMQREKAAVSKLEDTTTRFPIRQGCRVTLFQSAHVGEWNQKLAPLKVYTTPARGTSAERRLHAEQDLDWKTLDDSMEMPRDYVRRNCWEEIAAAMLQAKAFIYVVGWSVNPETTLLRERTITVPPYGEIQTTLTLGELLKMKAEEGVCVTVMIWSEATSKFVEDGVAGTGSSATFQYFQGSKVNIRAVERRNEFMTTAYIITHHQKGVMVDADPLVGQGPTSTSRRVVAFVGGLDLTKGRWDTPGKDLFGTLASHHLRDFYQTCLAKVPSHPGGTPEGPRQPWQDVHCKVEGPAAHDVVYNFEQRWLTQAPREFHAAVLNIAQQPHIMTPEEDVVFDPEHPESWDVQFFRSIDRYSDNSTKAVEADCGQAWLTAIERSERFLYIENQYFMGSSDYWKGGRSSNTPRNRIPIAIVDRILRAIRERKEYCAYICIPLHPEGLPDAGAIQEIMHFQYRTIEMMYDRIGSALQGVQGKHPRDYLNFFCLGRREPNACTPAAPLKGKDRRSMVLTNCRMQIYVHSK
eukprot:Sspe_Gene.95394::Locus_67698_Transcript_1_1_Confidence_1.000_Length_2476::g.95394::m.95394/K01115/PLD1_2; phospholipase D1/2